MLELLPWSDGSAIATNAPRALKKIQEELYKGKKKVEKKTELKKRDYKLTLSRALSDEDEIERQRSFASVKRAREKQTKKIVPRA